MSKFTWSSVLTITCSLLFSTFLFSQSNSTKSSNQFPSNLAAYQQAVQERIATGQFEGILCDESLTDALSSAERAGNCGVIDNGYGTNCWNPSVGLPSNRDAACNIPALTQPSCGKFRVPITITVFENPAWTGTNYLNSTGFVTLPDIDINAMLTNLNSIYGNANIEFYECKSRQRINNPDLYNFYPSTSDPENGQNDETQTTAYDTPNVLNLYFVGGFSGDHDCCGSLGYAYYPPSRDIAMMRYAAVNTAIVAHEIGHYFGLFHTHRNLPSLTSGGEANGTAAGLLDNCDCLTTGDGICDTWPDPNFATTCSSACGGGACFVTGGCDFNEAGYACMNSGGSLTINPSAGVDIGTGISTILEKNIMSYNQIGNCRTAFSPCQFRKIYETLLTCRDNLCYADVTADFTSTQLNHANSPYKEICVGDAPPTFNAKSECYQWYADATGGTVLATGSTFTPTAGTAAGQLNTNLIGTQDYWIADVNSFQTPACRRQVTIRIIPRPGTATVVDANLCCNESTTFVSNNINIDTCNHTIAWWRTTTPFSSTITAEAAFNALTPTQISNTIQNSSRISNAGTTASLNFTNNCSALSAGTYYLTPFVSRKAKAAVPAVVLTDNTGNTTNGSFNGFTAHRYNSGALAGVPAPDPCNPRGAPTFTISINVTSSNRTDIGFDFHPANNCTSTTPRLYTTTALNNNGNQGVGTYTFTQAQLPDFDPATGFCFWVFGNGGNLTAGFTVSITVTYPAIAEVTFPSFERACNIGNAVQFQISAPVTPPTANNKTICQGENSTLTATGLSGVNYVWYGPNNTTTLLQNATVNTYTPSITTAGTYTYYVSQRNTTGCESTQTPVTLTVNAAPNANISNVQTSCGSPILSAGNGAAGQGYLWSTGATTQTIPISNVGTYSVTVTQLACSSSSSYNVTALGLVATASNTSPVCSGSHFSLNASGGSSYAWSGPNGFSSTQQNPLVSNATIAQAGTYTVTITGTSSGTSCTATASTLVSINAVTATASNNSPVCLNGNVTLSSGGGSIYAWSGPNGYTASVQNPVIVGVNSSKTGAYTVTVTDANACTATATTTVSNAEVVATATANTPCLGGNISLQATGGLSYAWSGPNSFTSVLQNPNIANATIAKMGTYTVTVTTAASCTATATVTVSLSTVNAAVASNTGPYCTGNTIALSVNNAGISYSWGGPNSFSSTTQNPTIDNANSVKAGIYTVTVTNTNGCTGTATTKVVVNTAPNVTTTGNVSVCQGNSATLSANSTTAGVTYAWSGPNAFSATTAAVTFNPAQTAQTGTYTVTVTNLTTTCTATATANLNVGTVSVSASSNSPVCTGASLQLSAVGTGSFAWSGPNGFSSALQNPSINNTSTANIGTYIVTITGANSCTATASVEVQIGSEVFSASSNSPVCKYASLNLSAVGGVSYSWSGPSGFTSTLQNPSIPSLDVAQTGIYSVTVTAASGCTGVANTIAAISPVTATANATNGGNTCVGGNMTLNVTSTATDVSYTWSGPNGFSSTQQQPSLSNTQTNQSGNYVAVVTNSLGCTATDVVAVTIAQATGTAVSNSPVCTNSTLQLNVTGVQTGSTYAWSGPNNFFSVLKNPTIGNATASNSGVYTVTITLNGCTSISTTTVSVGNITPTVSSNSPVCLGSSINLFASGGTSYAWAGPNGLSSTTQNPTIPNANTNKVGTYTVTITSGSCVATATVVVALSTVTATASNTPNCGGATLSATGGVSYVWAGPNGFSSTLSNPNVSVSGTYTVTVTNATACTKTATTAVTIGTGSLTATASSNSPICAGGTLNLSANATGGTNLVTNGTFESGNTGFSSDYSYTTSRTSATQYGIVANPSSWYNFFSNCTAYGGSGKMLVADGATTANKRIWYRTITVTPNTNYQLSAYAMSVYNGTPARLIFKVGTVQVGSELNVGTSPCQWLPMNATFNSGSSTSVVISIWDNETAGTAGNNFALDNISCVAISGNFAWSGPNGFSASTQNPSIPNTSTNAAGIYTVTVTNSTGCTTTATVNVAINSANSIAASNNSPICVGGTINLSASGGTTYAWAGPNSYTSTNQNPVRNNATTTMAGTYTVTVSTSGGCSGTATTVVSINTATATASNSGAVCVGGAINLSASEGVSYNWAGPASFSATTQNPVRSNAAANMAGTYTVTVTNVNGCTATATTSVVVSTTTAVAGSNSPVGIGGNINLTASGGVSYAWSGPNGYSATTQNPVRNNAATNMAGVYVVTVTNATGCTATASVNVVVTSQAVSVTSNSPICSGGTLQLTSNVTGTAIAYNWSGPASFSSTAQNPTRSNMSSTHAGVYTVTVTFSGGTILTASTNVVVETFSINPDYNEVACDGDNLELYANPVGGSIGSISWTLGSVTSTTVNPVFSNATDLYEGTWTVSANSTNGCTSTKTLSTWINQVHGYITVSGDAWQNNNGTYSICRWDYLELYAENDGSGTEDVSYVYWEGPNGASTSGQYVDVQVPSTVYTGTYTAYITDGYGCTEAVSIYLNVINCGFKTDDLGGAILTAQPNPFDQSTEISFRASEQTDTRISVLDIVGRNVATLYHGVTQKGETYTFDFQADQLPNGLYFVQVQTDKGQLLTYQLDLIR